MAAITSVLIDTKSANRRVRRVDSQLRLPENLGGERVVQPRDGGQVRFTRQDQDRAERSGSDRYLQQAHGHILRANRLVSFSIV
jgi:hypothetical protein